MKFFALCLLLFFTITASAQTTELRQDNIEWHHQSKNSGESMPCGGGDIGLNVWSEHGDIYFYISRSGTFDEHNAFLKLGRVRIKLTPNPFDKGQFSQQLKLEDGSVYIKGQKGALSVTVHLWIDVHQPVIHVDIQSDKPMHAEADYESWRTKDHVVKGKENSENAYRFAPQGVVKTYKDHIGFDQDNILFYHRNKDTTIFDVTVKQQGLDTVKSQLFDPLNQLTFGGLMKGKNMRPAGTYQDKYLNTPFTGWRLKSKRAQRDTRIVIYLHTAQTPTADQWEQALSSFAKNADNDSWQKTKLWWQQFWDKSYIFIDPKNRKDTTAWQAGRNYQLFRYMLGCNAYGSYPTKFNGGLFTYDPVLVDSAYPYTPDFRNWGGGTFTAQNQRLVYYPMLKSGDFDMMKSQFLFYLRSLHNAELRSEIYWGHRGACFTEQLENFGLPDCSEYGWKRPANFDKGLQYNAWLEYEWDTVLEFCYMMLQDQKYSGADISADIPFIESCLTFFNEHYQYLAEKRGRKTFDADGHLVLYPGSACETYKMAYNATSTIAALQTVLKNLIALPDHYLSHDQRKKWQQMLRRIPPISFRYFDGHKTIAPAIVWQRINNVETPQLYPVFPWRIYGVGKPGLDIARNTWRYDTSVIKNRSYIGWKQDNIFAARLGLTNEAAQLTVDKLKNSGRRFPAFWGPGFDWAPDHNWGGTGMIGLQEMLLQTNGRKIYLFPAWPKSWNVHFKLHAPYQTTVEATLKNGQLINLKVSPEARKKDVVNMLSQ